LAIFCLFAKYLPNQLPMCGWMGSDE